MRIAVNARHLHAHLEGVGMVTDEVMRRMVQAHPEDQFDYYFDRRPDERFLHGPNVKAHALAPVTRLPLLIRYWLNNPVRKNIGKQKANIFFSPDGFIPLGMGTPKVSMVHDVAYLRYPQYLQPRIRKFYSTWMPRFLAYTDHIITVSEFSKKELIAGYNLSAEKISVVHNGITEGYKPLADAEKTKVRARYTQGKPYFLYLGSIHPRKNVATLVKAFDLFKGSMRTDEQLVLAGRSSRQSDDAFKAIDQSPFKSEIYLPGYVPTAEATRLVGGAEAMIYPSWYEGFGLPLVEAMACDVPVICSNVSSLPEVAGDAALLFDPADAAALASHLSDIVNDPALRQRLILSGRTQTGHFSWNTSAGMVYDILKKFGS